MKKKTPPSSSSSLASLPSSLPSSRRSFLQRSAGATAALSVADWLGFFRRHGVPGTSKDWGIAAARAQEANDDRYLVYWFVEGGWDSYSMFSPVDTRNDAGLSIPANTLNPNPAWSEQFYRPRGFGSGERDLSSSATGIRHGFLAAPGRALFPDMFVLSSLRGNTFHSGGRFELHYGSYNRSLQAFRNDDERTVLQAFAEAKGASFLLPHVSWHRWLSDGELDLGQYPDGTGYYEKLGPAYAHTTYGRTPRDLKARLAAIGDVATQQRRRVLRDFTDELGARFLRGRDGQSVRAFSSALEIHRSLADRGGALDLSSLFDDPALRAHFGVQPGDDTTTATSVNGNPARSKESPHIRVQAMMAYELMRARASCALWLETRDVRLFDGHRSRRNVLDSDGNSDQLDLVRTEIWQPLAAFVDKLKTTPAPETVDGSSLWDRTTIVLCSEMGRTIQGDVRTIVNDAAKTVDQRYQEILDQDVCQHWHVSSCAFLGGNVRGGQQVGGVGNQTLDHIPIRNDGSLDPAFDPVTGLANGAQTGFVPDAGHVYATALYTAGVDPTGRGRNNRPPLRFVARP
jgi:hypothetical protein